MMENWKDIEGYEDYQVSDMGRVKSLKRGKERILKGVLDIYGYLIVTLCENNKRKTFKIHKLVAIEFLNHIPCGYKEVVDHIDNNPLNNKVDNLQLISARENTSKDKKGGASKYTGVCWAKQKNKWKSSIYIKSKLIYLGLFINEEEAHLKYQLALENIEHFQNPKQFRDFLNIIENNK